MVKIIADTSIIIDFLRRKDRENSLYSKLFDKGFDVCLSLISVTEIYSGKSVQNEVGIKIIEDLLMGVEIYIPDLKMAQHAGKLRSEYELSLGDSFIAALALEKSFSVATLDRNDFSKVKGLKIFIA